MKFHVEFAWMAITLPLLFQLIDTFIEFLY